MFSSHQRSVIRSRPDFARPFLRLEALGMRRLLAVALSLWMLSLPQGSAFACSCAAPATTQQALGQAAAVFAGRVRSIEMVGAGEFQHLQVEFVVERVWKGQVGAVLQLATARDTGGCGFPFERGVSYLVYASAASGGLSSSLCSRTAPLEAAGTDLAELGEGTAPPLGSRPNPWLLGGGVVLLLLGGWLTWRNSRRWTRRDG
jgi:hypothetical protein